MAPIPTQVIQVTPSKKEIAAGRFTDAHIRTVLTGLHKDGVILIKDVIDPAHLDELNKHMVEDAKTSLRNGVSMNKGAGNIQQSPPFLPTTLLYEDVYMNRLLHHAVTLYLGIGAKWNLATGNTALPESMQRQPVHSDASSFRHPACPFYVVANIPLITSNVSTGATEIWLGGMHRGNSEEQHDERFGVKDELLDAQMNIQAPVQPTVEKGSILLRDLRLWHAGMPNPSSEYRCMIALGFTAPWYNSQAKFRVPADSGAAEILEEGLKGSTITPRYRIVSSKEYESTKNAKNISFEDDEINRL